MITGGPGVRSKPSTAKPKIIHPPIQKVIVKKKTIINKK